MVNVSVIIVNYNTYQLVKDCIESIYKFSENISFEIIVVDNASPDRSIDQISVDFPEVIYIKSPKNGGFGYANNLGAKHAKGKYLFLLNSDTILLNNAIKFLHDYICKNEKVGICGGNLYTINLIPDFSYNQMFPSVKAEIDDLFINFFSKRKYGKNRCFNFTGFPLKLNGFISGADLFISAELFSKIEGFNENFFMYYEDTDLNFRVKQLGLEIHSVPDAKIIHFHGGSQKALSRLQSIWINNSRRLYYKANFIKGFQISLFLKCLSLLKSFIGNLLFLRFSKAKDNLIVISMLLNKKY